MASHKITVRIPADLLKRAQRATGKGITQTVRAALQALVVSNAYDQLRGMRGKVRLSKSWVALKDDR